MLDEQPSRAPAQEAVRPVRSSSELESWVSELPDIASALKHDCVSFDQLLEAHFGRDGSGRDPHDGRRKAYAAVYPRVLEAFQQVHGDIQKIHYGANGSGVAVTQRRIQPSAGLIPRLPWSAAFETEHQIHIRFDVAGTADVLDLQDRCEYFRVQQFRLSPQYIAPYVDRLFNASSAVLRIDETNKDGLHDWVKASGGVLADVRDRYEWVLNRKARTDYLKGVGYGLCGVGIGLLILLGILGLVLRGDPTVVWCMAGGAMAAAANAMLRLVQGTPTVQGEESHLLITLFGAFRPALGAVFALIAYALIVGGILPVKVPSDGRTLFWFVIGIAFIAGFSEGFTPDLVQTAARRIGGTPASGSGAQRAPSGHGQ
ncbi:MAG: hypothetical protein DLM67_02505 [Candidatus Nephthysia bennettiae]|uniref:Uncharacterized protein n=1 Tax=Candidatus Nephthysia bennettiae TaxID=3127016 RepID=A0A934KAH6_9BACT|nr:hypothetical protein [Candidatus Dormibacteraeota bacterium]MBJ7613938.1 hypothetical protein [Candidatus Dormibacteraeota bacterium]PZR99921.1 MAG: hypothetical protein DLM67_02505 [Candidatus Dormibacteraeota bacterium]